MLCFAGPPPLPLANLRGNARPDHPAGHPIPSPAVHVAQLQHVHADRVAVIDGSEPVRIVVSILDRRPVALRHQVHRIRRQVRRTTLAWRIISDVPFSFPE